MLPSKVFSNERKHTHNVLIAQQHVPGSKVPVDNVMSSEVGHSFSHLHTVAVHLLQVDKCAVAFQEVQEGAQWGHLFNLSNSKRTERET